MNKAELIEALAARLGDRKTATAALDAVISEVQNAVTKGDRVAITGFGVFEKRARNARTARNPRTGEPVMVKKTSVPAFKPGTGFREMVASGKVAKATLVDGDQRLDLDLRSGQAFSGEGVRDAKKVQATLKALKDGGLDPVRNLDEIAVCANQDEAKNGKAQRSTVVTLAVLPADGERIALAAAEGSLSLVLRNPLDVDPADTAGIKLAALMKGTGPEAILDAPKRKMVPAKKPVVVAPPAPQAPQIYKVEAIRAAKRTEEAVH